MALSFPRIARAAAPRQDQGEHEFEVSLQVYRLLCTLDYAAATRVMVHVGEALEDRKNLRLVEDEP